MPDTNNDGSPIKKKKVSLKIKKISDKNISTQYDKYSGIVNEKGESVENPSSVEAIKNMAKYMMRNQSDQSNNPSNVYRPEYSHKVLNYNRKQKQTDA